VSRAARDERPADATEPIAMPNSAMESMVRAFAHDHPADAARALEGLDPERAAGILKRLPSRVAGHVTERLAPEAAGMILPRVGEDGMRALLSDVPPRQAAAILHHLEDALREATLANLPPERAKGIQNLLQYPLDSAGGMMDPRITSIRVDLRAGDAIAAVRRAPRHTLYYLYVTTRSSPWCGATW
jgi:magnesium transporter